MSGMCVTSLRSFATTSCQRAVGIRTIWAPGHWSPRNGAEPTCEARRRGDGEEGNPGDWDVVGACDAGGELGVLKERRFPWDSCTSPQAAGQVCDLDCRLAL